MFYIYTIQNKINNKLYVGWTSDYKQRWRDEKKNAFRVNSGDYNNLLSRAFRKYSKNTKDIENHFIFQVIEEYSDNEKSESHLAEAHFIEFFRTNINKFGKDAGYNMTSGGEFGTLGFKHSQETKDKISKIKKDNPSPKVVWTNEMRVKMSENNKGNGKKITQDIANNIRTDYRSGNYSLNDLNKKYKIAVARAIIYNEIWTDEKYALTQLEINKIIDGNIKKICEIPQEIIDNIRFDFMNKFKNLSFADACKVLLLKYKNIKGAYMRTIISNRKRKTNDVQYINFIKNKGNKLNQNLADQLRNDYNLICARKTEKIKILSRKYSISAAQVYSVLSNKAWIKNES